MIREAAKQLWITEVNKRGLEPQVGWTYDKEKNIRVVGWRPLYKRMKKWFLTLNHKQRSQLRPTTLPTPGTP